MERRYTNRVPLSGGQDRLRQAILYVCAKNASSTYFGRTKLNKILWKADFSAYAETGIPVTGRDYQRLEHGPAPKEMLPLYREMKLAGMITEEVTDFGGGVREYRPTAVAVANVSNFTDSDIAYLDSAITYYWEKTGRETSDDSHGAAWRSRHDGDPMPYESSLLSDERPSASQLTRLRLVIDAQGCVSR